MGTATGSTVDPECARDKAWLERPTGNLSDGMMSTSDESALNISDEELHQRDDSGQIESDQKFDEEGDNDAADKGKCGWIQE